MEVVKSNKRQRRFIVYFLGFFLLVFLVFFFFAHRFVEPVLRDRLHTLIVQGSDSLYRYHLGSLKSNFFGGNVEVEDLKIRVDSVRYHQLKQQNALPSLSFELDLQKGHIKGIGVYSLIFGRQIKITEILSQEANLKVSRHVYKKEVEQKKTIPLWKAIQPVIKSIRVDAIKLDGVKLLFKSADTSQAVKLQFDRCIGLFKDIKIDSASEADTSRIAFTKDIAMQFYDLKFRTPDSSYKMKAEVISYSSKNRFLEITDFKLQPTLKKEDFIRTSTYRQGMYVVLFEKVRFTNLRLEKFINSNIINTDSILISKPDISIYNDKTLPPDLKNKIGTYPHQRLLNADAVVMVKGIRIAGAQLSYTEKNEKNLREGKLEFSGLNAVISNVTNDAALIRQNPECTAEVNATIFRTSPVQARFTFHLDSTEGEFSVQGEVKNVNAAQLNEVTEPLANTYIRSLDISYVRFQIHGDDYTARGTIQMRYNNLAMVLKKVDKETGMIKTKKFLTKILNRLTLHASNPGSDGRERIAHNVVYARVSSKSFFGVVWKTIFAGMQKITTKTVP